MGARKGDGTQALHNVAPHLTRESARTMACKYMRDPKILQAIRNLADGSLRANVLIAQDVLTGMMEGVFNGQPVKPETALKAAVEILNRAGLIVSQTVKHEHTIEDNRTEKELLAHIKNRMEELGVAQNLQIVDASFEEVDGAAPYGRKKDGTPRRKNGRIPWKRRLTPPPPKKVEDMNPEELRRHKMDEQIKAAREQLKANRKKRNKEATDGKGATAPAEGV